MSRFFEQKVWAIVYQSIWPIQWVILTHSTPSGRLANIFGADTLDLPTQSPLHPASHWRSRHSKWLKPTFPKLHWSCGSGCKLLSTIRYHVLRFGKQKRWKVCFSISYFFVGKHNWGNRKYLLWWLPLSILQLLESVKNKAQNSGSFLFLHQIPRPLL